MSEQKTPSVPAVPQQYEITLETQGDYIVINQRVADMNDPDPVISVHRNNLAALILALRRLDGQEV